MHVPAMFAEFLRGIAHLQPAQQNEEILRFFVANVDKWDRTTVTALRDYFAAKGTQEGNTLAEVLEGNLALRDLRALLG